jgi:hypothetical protein|nr:MAG TPA: hypothetical protein [Caudoviricetes sp.]
MDKPQPKFNRGDKVHIKNLPHSELETQSHGWNHLMDGYIGRTLTIKDPSYRCNTNIEQNGRNEQVWIYFVRETGWSFEEHVLEPHIDKINNHQLVWI